MWWFLRLSLASVQSCLRAPGTPSQYCLEKGLGFLYSTSDQLLAAGGPEQGIIVLKHLQAEGSRDFNRNEMYAVESDQELGTIKA